MPQFYTDPSISWQTLAAIQGASDPWPTVSRFMQLKALQQEMENRRLYAESAKLRIEQERREAKRQAAIEGAAGEAFMPSGRQIPAMPTAPGGPMDFYGQQAGAGVVPEGQQPPMELNRGEFLSKLASRDPYAAFTYQQDFAAQDKAAAEAEEKRRMQAAKDAAQLAKDYSALSKDQREQYDWVMEKNYIPAIEHILSLPPDQRPQAWDGYLQMYSQSPNLFPQVKQFPRQYTPQLEDKLQMTLEQYRIFQQNKKKPDTSMSEMEWADRQAKAEGLQEGTPAYAARVAQLKQSMTRPPAPSAGGVAEQDEIDAYLEQLQTNVLKPSEIPMRVRGKVMVEAKKRGIVLAAAPTSYMRQRDAAIKDARGMMASLRERFEAYRNEKDLGEKAKKWALFIAKARPSSRQLGRSMGEVGVFTTQDEQAFTQMLLGPFGLTGTVVAPSITDAALKDAEAFMEERIKAGAFKTGAPATPTPISGSAPPSGLPPGWK